MATLLHRLASSQRKDTYFSFYCCGFIFNMCSFLSFELIILRWPWLFFQSIFRRKMIWKLFFPFGLCSGFFLFWIFQLQWLALHEIVFQICKVNLFMQLRNRRKVEKWDAEDFDLFYFTSLSLAFTSEKVNIAPWIKLIDQLHYFNMKSIYTL